MNERRDFDIVVYGATGYVGRRVVRYLEAAAPALRFAVAGRDRDKLAALGARDAAGPAEVLVGGSDDTAALATIAARTRVVLDVAGPFAKYGTPVVDACVAARTHYVDITGETPWIRSIIDRYHDRAAADGTRIVPSCGFDSVPADIGALLVARELGDARDVRAFYTAMGGVNGGTLASLFGMSADDASLKAMADPFLLDPPGAPAREPRKHRDPAFARFDAAAGTWTAPFFMGPINTRVVRRSEALFATYGEPYGTPFAYQEYLKFPSPLAPAIATAVAAGSYAFTSALRVRGVRDALEPLLPKPGSGPSERAMQAGWFRCDLVGRGPNGTTARATIADRGDPGNVATTKFVCESALALALDFDRLPGGPARGGVLTPATALGSVLVERLRGAGMTIESPA